MLTNFANTFSASALNIAIPHIGSEYHASATAVSWIVLAFLLVSALLAIPFGRIADIYGRIPMLRYGILLFCITSLLNIFSQDMITFLIFRALQGVGAAMIFATNTAILVDAHPAEKRGSVMGISVMAVFIGSALGPVVGGLMTHAFGWRSIFLLITAFAMIALYNSMLHLKTENIVKVQEKVNITSIVLFILSLGLFMYGLVTLMQNIWSYITLAAGIALIIVFVKHEIKTKVPVVEMSLFKNSEFTLSILAALFNFAAVFAVIYLLSIYLQLARGLSADLAGLIMISQPVVQAILSPIAGKMSDKRSPAAIVSIGMGFCAASLFMFAFLTLETSLVYIVVGLLLTGVGVALFASPNSSMIMGSVDNKHYSVAASMMSSSRMIGQVFGMALLTIIVNAVIGNVPIAEIAPALIVYDMQVSFPIFGAICCVGIFFSLRRGVAKSHEI